MNDRYQGYRVLIVEDDDGSFLGTKNEVEEITGLEPVRALGVSDAIQILDQWATDDASIHDPRQILALVIIDQNLSLAADENRAYPDIDPKEGGLFLIRHVRERCPLASVGVLTAYASSAEEKKFRAGKLNADFYWDKAEHPAKLRSEIKLEIDRFLESVASHNAGVE